MTGWRVYRKYLVVTLVAVLLTVGMSYINRDPEHWHWPQVVVRSALQPFQRAMQGATDRISGAWQDWQELGQLRDENRRLREQMEEMEFVHGHLRELEEENQRLTELLELEDNNAEFDLMAARVVARDPDNWHQGLTINRGSEHGVEPDMAVMTSSGLVGRVTSVGLRQAEVLLLLDQRSSVGALLQDCREPGVVQGHDVGDEPLRMLYVSPDAEVQAGEQVVTSGLGTIFPKGLPIGVVADVRHDEFGVGQYAVVRPQVDFHRLEEVMVVLSAREETAE